METTMYASVLDATQHQFRASVERERDNTVWLRLYEHNAAGATDKLTVSLTLLQASDLWEQLCGALIARDAEVLPC